MALLFGPPLPVVSCKSKVAKDSASASGSHRAHVGEAVGVVALRGRRGNKADGAGIGRTRRATVGLLLVAAASMARVHHGRGQEADIRDTQSPNLADVLVGD